jgi:ubiquinone/menaquinone biosynthesis C-methylase UbiE
MTLNVIDNIAAQPSAQRALDNYRALAAGYDTTCTRIVKLRLIALHSLALQPGETVFDIACGTGPTLPLLASAVGPAGNVVGVELCPEMAALARARIAAISNHGNVSVAQTAVENFAPSAKADALLLCYTQDVLQSDKALDRLIASAKPGARITILGMKTVPWLWGWPANIFNMYRARRYMTTYTNLDRPWRLLEQRGANLQLIHTALLGSAYVVTGTMPMHKVFIRQNPAEHSGAQ